MLLISNFPVKFYIDNNKSIIRLIIVAPEILVSSYVF